MSLLALVCFAALLGIIPAAIAKNKGYSFFDWWFYGTLLWVAAFPHSLVLKTKQAALEQRNIDSGLERCPMCKEWIQAGANLCRFCGVAITGSKRASLPSFDTVGSDVQTPTASNKGVSIVLALGILGLGIVVVLASVTSNRHSAGATITPVTSEANSSLAQKSSPDYRTPATLLEVRGNGMKSTRKIVVPDEWTMSWSYDCASFGQSGNFVVTIYADDGTMRAVGTNQLGYSGSDTEYFHQGGTIYLQVNSECHWAIHVKG